MISLAFEWNKEPTDFNNCFRCKQLILSDMYVSNVFSGFEIVGRFRMCEDCFNNPKRLPPEFIISEQKISRCEDEQTIELQAGAIILTVVSKNENDVFLFIYHDKNEHETEERKIYTSLSGRPLKAPVTRYIGSVFIFSGKSVLHVYE